MNTVAPLFISLNTTVAEVHRPYLVVLRRADVNHEWAFLCQQYGSLASKEAFYRFTAENNAMMYHTPMANPFTEALLDEDTIKELCDAMWRGKRSAILSEMGEVLNEDGFVVLKDDWDNFWVYVGNDATRFNEWYDFLL